jgi:hypothetical protein
VSGLATLQRWMQEVLTHPAGINPTGVSDAIRPSAMQTPVERLAIYNRAYHARLFDAMEGMFPALLHALGGELFRRFALGHLQVRPPASFSINRIGDEFPRYLAETRPDDEEDSWPDFIIELAELELAYLHVHDGPGIEGSEPRVPRRVDVFALRPVPAPSLRLFTFRHPVHRYHAAVRRGEKPETPTPAPCFVAMSRRRYQVFLWEIPAAQYSALKNLDGHRTLGEAIGPPQDLAVLHAWIAEWTRNGYLARFET